MTITERDVFIKELDGLVGGATQSIRRGDLTIRWSRWDEEFELFDQDAWGRQRAMTTLHSPRDVVDYLQMKGVEL